MLACNSFADYFALVMCAEGENKDGADVWESKTDFMTENHSQKKVLEQEIQIHYM